MSDSQRLEDGGILPFIDLEDGVNLGQFLEDYISHLNIKNDNLFQRPQRPSKKFDIHSNDVVC